MSPSDIAANALPSADQAPWDREDLFPEKPADADYGYLLKGKFCASSKEELINHCEKEDIRRGKLVWHPGALRIMEASQVHFLFETVRTKEAATLKRGLGMALFNTISWLFLIVVSFGSKAKNWHLFMFTAFGVLPLCQNWWALRKLKCMRWQDMAAHSSTIRFNYWINTQRAKFSWVLLSIIMLVALGQLLVGLDKSVNLAGLDKRAVWAGEWWRLLTAPLLHANPLHLLLNAMSLFVLGKVIEILTSRHQLAFVFLAAALTGSVFSLFLLEETSVGASGGIMGFIGFLFILGYRRSAFMPTNYAKSLAVSILITAGMGVAGATFIDNAAHLGGLIAGLVCGLLWIKPSNNSLPLTASPSMRFAGWLSLLVSLGTLAFVLSRFYRL